MKKLHLILSALLLMGVVACGDDENDYQITGKRGTETQVQTDERQSNGPDIAKYSLEFPALKGGKSVVVVHNAKLNNNKTVVNFSVEWDTEMHAQRWTCYQMYSDVNVQNVQRYDKAHDVDNTLSYATGQYPNDPELPAAYQFTKDSYKGSGYDHGHICPSQDRVCSEEANRQTFCMTNMQPQNHNFNAGIWEKMEDQVRKWAKSFDTLFVCKGGTIDKSEWIIKYLGSGSNMIPVPKYFFMAVLGKKGANFKATGFWIAQDNYSSTALKSYAVTISTLQSKTGIDFFCNLPDDIENEVENISQTKMESEWTWYQ